MSADQPAHTPPPVRLGDPFPAKAVHWKAQTVKQDRCLAVPYIDARDVMDRLDDAVGQTNWQDSYQDFGGGRIVCTLRVRLGGEWIEHQDVGGESGQPDDGDKAKAAFSDALKRAAVKFGIGRYLYQLPKYWVEYDPAKRSVKTPPTLPTWALPVQERTKERPASQPAKTATAPTQPAPAAPASQPARTAAPAPAKLSAQAEAKIIERLQDMMGKAPTPDALGAVWDGIDQKCFSPAGLKTLTDFKDSRKLALRIANGRPAA